MKKKTIEYIMIFIIFVSSIILVNNFFNNEMEYLHFKNDSVEYVRGKVIEIVEQELVLSNTNEYLTGYQKAIIEIENNEIEIDNYVTLTHNVILKEGSNVIVYVDEPEGIKPFYSVYNYDRSIPVMFIISLFLLLMILVGKVKGLRSGIGLGFTIAIVVCFMIPNLYNGYHSGLIIFTTIILSSIGSCFCISGFEKKTLCNIISTSLGGIIAGLVYYLFTSLMNVNGGSFENAEELLLISKATGMSLQSIMFACIMIAVLGAVMDVAVSIGASLWEIKEKSNQISRKELFISGMNIGKDMIGTMSNTLILAFLGGSLPTLLIYISYGVQFNQFISSNFFALELIQGIAGSFSVILSVPISSFICSLLYNDVEVNHEK